MLNLKWLNQKDLLKHNSVQVIIFCLVIIVLSGGCIKNKSSKSSIDPETMGKPVDVDPTDLQPGLNVMYVNGFWRHINLMPNPETFLKKGWHGKPIKKIDHRFGNNEVFDSGKTRGVGVQMTGFINLSQAGLWQFKAKSNDGIDIKIAQMQVALDPAQHSDRFSKSMEFTVTKPGWYPILLRYFQRKGTATLEFYWKPPGASEFTIIPESAYWHPAG